MEICTDMKSKTAIKSLNLASFSLLDSIFSRNKMSSISSSPFLFASMIYEIMSKNLFVRNKSCTESLVILSIKVSEYQINLYSKTLLLSKSSILQMIIYLFFCFDNRGNQALILGFLLILICIIIL